MGLLDAIKNAFDPQRGDGPDAHDPAEPDMPRHDDAGDVPTDLSDSAQGTAPADSRAASQAPTHDPAVTQADSVSDLPAEQSASTGADRPVPVEHPGDDSASSAPSTHLAEDGRKSEALGFGAAAYGQVRQDEPAETVPHSTSPYAAHTSDGAHASDATAGAAAEPASPVVDSQAASADAVTVMSDGLVSVGEGEHLAWVAERYGVDADALAAANGLTRGEGLRAGQQLRLPQA